MTLHEKFDVILDYEIRQQQARKFIQGATEIRDIYNRIVQYFGTQQIGEIFPDSARPFTDLEIIIQNELESLINY
jgi:hypothetical protein